MPKSPAALLAIGLPVPGSLGVLLNAGPIRATLHFSRADGAPLTPGDVADVEASLAAWEASDAQRAQALPSSEILEAVARGGGLVPGGVAAQAVEANRSSAAPRSKAGRKKTKKG